MRRKKLKGWAKSSANRISRGLKVRIYIQLVEGKQGYHLILLALT
ncbi:MAG: hypothetical protein QXM53_10075 [Thermofilaceae archaeon]